MRKEAQARIENKIGEPIHSFQGVSGGCIADSQQIKTVSGKKFLLKQSRSAQTGMFSAEAKGLNELRKSGAILVPQVVFQDDDLLLLQWIENSRRNTATGQEKLGQQLARMHQFHGPKFGFSEDNFIGNSPQKNQTTSQTSKDWVAFYAENRLRFQGKLAGQNGVSTRELQVLLEKLISQLPELLSGTEEPPSLLHGDLWSGNYLVDQAGNPWLIDPAVYYGHREAELAMTSLFGGFSSTFYSAYEDAFPLAPGYSEREPLYQLYHLINHLNLFGSGYYGQVISILRHYVGN